MRVMLSEITDLKKVLLNLFSVIESPIMVFSPHRELLYTIWPHSMSLQAETLAEVGNNKSDKNEIGNIEFSDSEDNLAADVNYDKTELNLAIKSETPTYVPHALTYKDLNLCTKPDIINYASQLVANWQRSIGEPLYISKQQPVGGLLLANGMYVMVGPIVPLKIKTPYQTLLLFNKTALSACNMWFKLYKIQSRTLEHAKVEAPSPIQGASMQAGSAHSSSTLITSQQNTSKLTESAQLTSILSTSVPTKQAFNTALTNSDPTTLSLNTDVVAKSAPSSTLASTDQISDLASTEQNLPLISTNQSNLNIYHASSLVNLQQNLDSYLETPPIDLLTSTNISLQPQSALVQSYTLSTNKTLIFDSIDLSKIDAAIYTPYNPYNGDGISEAFDIKIDHASLKNIWSVNVHNLYRNEVLTQEAIREGDIEKLQWAYQLPNKGKIGILGPTPLRSWQNHAHLHNVLASRAAIDAGVTPEEAYTLSDKLFLAVEAITDPMLAKHMRYVIARSFAELVQKHRTMVKESVFEPPLIRKARFSIQKNLTSKITLGELSEKLGCSEQHLCRLFKKTYKQSVMQYVFLQRINLAKDLLKESDLSISDIASLLQFASCSHFCRVFKQHMQLSPAKWRQQHAFVYENSI